MAYTPGANTPATGGAFVGSSGTAGISALDFVGQKELSLPVRLTAAPPAPNGIPGLGGPPLVGNQLPSSVTGITTIGDALSLLGTMDTATLTQLQTQLYAGHFYSNTYYSGSHPPIEAGVPDDATVAAYTRALREAARNHQPLDQIIRAGTSITDISGTGTVAGAPQVREFGTTAPAQLRADVDKAAVSVLGKKVSDSERQALVDAVIGAQTGRGQEVAALESKALGPQTASATGTQAMSAGNQGTPEGAQAAAQAAYNAGARGQALVTATAVALAENGGNPRASLNDNPGTGDYSVGYWQINYYGGLKAERTAKYGAPQAVQNDPALNAAAARDLSGNWTNFDAWTTYKSGAYRNYLKTATDAANAVQNVASASSTAPVGTTSSPPSSSFPNSATAIPSPAASAPGVGGVVAVPVQDVNAAADVTEQIRAAHPAEAGAHDSTAVYATMLDMLRKVA